MTWLKNLEIGLKLTTALTGVAAVPYLGPFLSGVGAIFSFLWWLVTLLWSALQLAIANPAAFSLIIAALAAGVYQGIKWDGHLVLAADTRLASLETQLKDRDNADALKAKAAIAARDAAEKTAATAGPLPELAKLSSTAVAAKFPSAPKSRVAAGVQHIRDKADAFTALFCSTGLCDLSGRTTGAKD